MLFSRDLKFLGPFLKQHNFLQSKSQKNIHKGSKIDMKGIKQRQYRPSYDIVLKLEFSPYIFKSLSLGPWAWLTQTKSLCNKKSRKPDLNIYHCQWCNCTVQIRWRLTCHCNIITNFFQIRKLMWEILVQIEASSNEKASLLLLFNK